MSELIDNEKELDEILKTNDRVAILFYASWCPFSARFLPIFEKHAKNIGGSCRRILVDDKDALIDNYSVEVYPTVIFFNKGKVVKRLDGVHGEGLNEKKLVEFINTCGL